MAWLTDRVGLVVQVTANGDVSVVAGGGAAFEASGTGPFAGLTGPQAIAVDTAGTVFLADDSALFRSVPTLPDRATVDRSIGLVGQPFILKQTPYTSSSSLWTVSRKPGGSLAAPLAPTSASTSLIPDVADLFEVRLTASGPTGESVSAVSFQAVSRGDLNADGALDVFDVVSLAGHIVGNVTQGVAPFLSPREAADVNGDQARDLFDVVLLQAVIVGNATVAP